MTSEILSTSLPGPLQLPHNVHYDSKHVSLQKVN